MSDYCPNCGQSVVKGSTFCQGCGRKLVSEPLSRPGYQESPVKQEAMVSSLMHRGEECLIKNDPLGAYKTFHRILEITPNDSKVRNLMAEIDLIDRKHPNLSMNATYSIWMTILAFATGTLTVFACPFLINRAKEQNEDPGKIRTAKIFMWTIFGLFIGAIPAAIIINNKKNQADALVGEGHQFMQNGNHSQAEFCFKSALQKVDNHAGAVVFLRMMGMMNY